MIGGGGASQRKLTPAKDHCPWTGHCIGSSNLVFFQAFLASLVVEIVVFVVCVVVLAARKGQIDGAAGGSRVLGAVRG